MIRIALLGCGLMGSPMSRRLLAAGYPLTVWNRTRAKAEPQVRLFAGWRVNRQDSGSKRWASKWANAIRARMLRDDTPDTGCGIKLFEREAFLDLPYFDHMHRYLPALMQRAGWKTVSVPVSHRPRGSGQSKYTNLGRALLLLQQEKLITLKAGTGLLPTAVDITDNPHNLKIMELEGAQLPRVLDDPKVDVAIISTTYLQQTGLSPVRDGIFIEDKNSPYVNIIVTREDNKDAENVKEFMQSYQSPEVEKAAETIFNGGAVPGW